MPAIHAAFCTDECAWSEQYTLSRPSPSVDAPTTECRAATTAVTVAAEPPLVSNPPAPSGIPIHCRNHSSTVSSTSFGPAATDHTPAKKLNPVASQSPITAGYVGQLGM